MDCEPCGDKVGCLRPCADEVVVLLVAVADDAKPSQADAIEAAVMHKAAEIDHRSVIMKGKDITFIQQQEI